MSADFDAPGKNENEEETESLDELRGRKDSSSNEVDDDEAQAAEDFELPGAVLDEQLTVQVVPEQDDEFCCSQCFIVHHRSQIAYMDDSGLPVCTECA